jgi:hypothetical protein
MSDFKIQRGAATIATSATTATITAGTDYTAPAALSKAFIRITAYGALGNESVTLTRAPDISAAYISNPANLLTSITFARLTSDAGTGVLVEWEIVEYIGSAAGANEFVVRGQEALAYTTTSNTKNGTALTGVGSNSKMFVFLTGQGGETAYDDAMSSFSWDSANQWVTATRDRSSSVNCTVSYAAIEFTGSNWTVQRVSHTFAAAGAQEDVSITDVGALTRAFGHAQFLPGGGTDGKNYNMSCQAWLSATNTASFKLDSQANAPTGAICVMWILSNSQTGTGAANCQRKTGTFTTDGNEGVTITAVADTTQSSAVEISQTNTQNTTSPGRDQCSYSLTSTTNVRATHVGLAGTTTYRFAVFEWPTAATGSSFLMPPFA